MVISTGFSTTRKFNHRLNFLMFWKNILPYLHSDSIWLLKCCDEENMCYIGNFERIWSITAMEDGKRS